MKFESSYRRIKIVKRSLVADLLKRPINDGVPAEIFGRIAGRYPGYVTSPDFINLERPKGHPDLDELLTYAKEAGATIQRDKSDAPAQVYIMDYTIYTKEEQLSAQLVECLLHDPVMDSIVEVDDGGTLGFCYALCAESSDSERLLFGSVPNLPHVIAVRGMAKKLLEAADLKHLCLMPLLTNSVDGDWTSSSDQLYFIWSNYELPPIRRAMFDGKGTVYPIENRPEESEKGCYLLDGYEMRPQLCYGNISSEEFDVARSRERVGGKEECYTKLVFSQRARKVLEDIGMNLELQPVVVRSGVMGDT